MKSQNVAAVVARAEPIPLCRGEQGAKMKVFSRKLVILLLFALSTVATSAQKVEFSADVQVSDGMERTKTLKLFVGNMRARFDLPKQGDETNGISSLLIDFDRQFIFLPKCP